ncbi:MAG: hypothetical protein LBN07_03530 [Christensenellaceae bacterium]|jgi:membrane-bound serine protease (ClpP class)|nr:hypothetical protein [Christensenellaceae bacterium]
MNQTLLLGEFATLFSEMPPASWITLVLGFVLLMVEFFIPGFGVCGILGLVSLTASVVLRAVYGGSFPQITIMVALILAVCAIGFAIMISSSKKGFISKTPIIQKGTAVPTDYADMKAEEAELLGKKGTLVTSARPIGKVMLEGRGEIEVWAREGLLVKGTDVVVVEVNTDKIFVTKA